MKKQALLSSILAAAFLCGCSDDLIDNEKKVVNPVQNGQEIIFGSTLTGDGTDETRTVYGTRTDSGIPVYWDAKGDKVAIFCKQTSQPANHLVNYTVLPQDGKPSSSASVTKEGETGLQWGDEDEHRFFAFYPASAVKGTEEEDQTGMITASIPVNQQPASWIPGTLDGKATYFGLPNMNYAYMYAYHAVKKSETPDGTAIDLEFKNLVTVLDITVQGPETNEPSVTVTNIVVTAVGGNNTILTGDFTCNIRGAEDNSDEVTAKCEATGDFNEVRNTISIPCYNQETGEYITLNAGEQLNVKAYIIPDSDDSKTQQLQVAVSTLNGSAKVKRLATTDVTPHKVNRVLLPKLATDKSDDNYWMSRLDPNIYVTELSWPGSKMSLLTSDNKADIVYQTTDIAQQLKDGVRAFIFQTQRSSDNVLYLSVNGKALTTTLTQALGQIATFLADCQTDGKQESAFAMVTYNGGYGSESDWFNLLQSTINTCANNSSYRIFNGDLSPNTTLGDVANKIIVKSNYNSSDMIASAGTAPMLHSLWNTPYVEGGVPMTWNNPLGSRAFTWLYQEVTSVVDDTRNVCGDNSYGLESNKTDKQSYIQEIFEKSVDAYKNNTAHDMWFMNDLGGYYGYCSNTRASSWWYNHSHTEVTDVTGLTKDMNALGVQLLQARTENAALGLVYMNFANHEEATGVAYRSDYLISTIIDNNFKFALRKKGDSSSQSYNASYATGGNAIGWDE